MVATKDTIFLFAFKWECLDLRVQIEFEDSKPKKILFFFHLKQALSMQNQFKDNKCRTL